MGYNQVQDQVGQTSISCNVIKRKGIFFGEQEGNFQDAPFVETKTMSTD